MGLLSHLPPEAFQILLVLFLSFLIGLEREEHKAAAGPYAFGGIRTFPLIGLIGYSLALISGTQLVPLTLGFLAVTGFLLLSYWHKLMKADMPGVTTEMSGLATFLVGALVCYGHFWIATTLGVASLLLLDLKVGLEKLASRVDANEILTFAKFLLLSAVILPVLPNQEFGPFHINPFKTWLVVVAISAISYASYVLQKLSKGQGGIVLAALLGGAYSSTVTTVVLAKQGKNACQPHLYSGGILMASGVMYLRLAILLALFNRQLMALLLVPFVVLAVVAVVAGWLWSRRPDKSTQTRAAETGTQKSAGADDGVFVCAAVPGNAGGHATRGEISRTSRHRHAGRDHGRDRCRSVHHGAHASRGNGDSGQGCGYCDSDCRRQQQRGERNLRLQHRRTRDRRAKPGDAGYAGAGRIDAYSVAGVVKKAAVLAELGESASESIFGGQFAVFSFPMLGFEAAFFGDVIKNLAITASAACFQNSKNVGDLF